MKLPSNRTILVAALAGALGLGSCTQTATAKVSSEPDAKSAKAPDAKSPAPKAKDAASKVAAAKTPEWIVYTFPG